MVAVVLYRYIYLVDVSVVPSFTVYQYVEDELVIHGDVLRADVSRAKLVKAGFGSEVHCIHPWGKASDCSEDNRSEAVD